MPAITLKNVTKRYGNFYAVENLNLDIDDNAFITLLGPSGCGKTTTLRMIAGLETPTSGRIKIGDTVVFDSEAGINIPPNKRRVGFLFQNYALWPNMTVYQNISFGLSNVKREMPTVDDEAKRTACEIEALKRPAEIKKIFDESKIRDGKTDNNKVYLKLIDTFTMSLNTAKEFAGWNLAGNSDVKAACEKKSAELSDKLASIRKNYQSKGQDLNEKFEVTSGGRPVTSVRKLTKEQIDLTVRRVSRIVKIGMFMDRYPSELSGGQQQRVAIARTLAPEPQVLFMDEPLSNLDAKLRLEMRYELQRLHLETGSTFVYVTHDQMEAMTLATKICLISNGVLQQYDKPLELYHKPTNIFTADFVGNPSINFIDAKGKQNADGSISLDIFDGRKAVFVPNEKLDLAAWDRQRDQEEEKKAAALAAKKADKNYVEKGNKDEAFRYPIQLVEERDDSLLEQPVLTDSDLVLGIRPEYLNLDEKGGLTGEMYGVMPTGMESTIKIAVGNYLLTGVIFGSEEFAIGQKHSFGVDGDRILLFDRKSEKLIAQGRLEISG